MSEDMHAEINALIARQIAANAEAVERACERMLVLPGDFGVLVTPQPDGAVVAELSHRVPFGEVHYLPHAPWRVSER